MLFMVIEKFKDRDPRPIYERFADRGRMNPEGLRYIDSWIEANFDRCFQLMECDNPADLQRWIMEWRDLVDFELVPVVPSAGTREVVLERRSS